jgi:hypothetical protein
MKTGRPKQHVCLSSEEKEQLRSMGNSGSLRYGLVARIRPMLRAAEGASNREIAGKIGLSAQSVCEWRRRFLDQDLFGLRDELRPGRGHNLPGQEEAAVTESLQ